MACTKPADFVLPTPTSATFNRDMVTFFKSLRDSVDYWNCLNNELTLLNGSLTSNITATGNTYRQQLQDTLALVTSTNANISATNDKIASLTTNSLTLVTPAVDTFTLSTTAVNENTTFTLTLPSYSSSLFRYELSFNPSGSTYVDNGNGTFTITPVIQGATASVTVGIRQRLNFASMGWSAWSYKNLVVTSVTADSNGTAVSCTGSNILTSSASTVSRILGVASTTMNNVTSVMTTYYTKDNYNSTTKILTLNAVGYGAMLINRILIYKTADYTKLIDMTVTKPKVVSITDRKAGNITESKPFTTVNSSVAFNTDDGVVKFIKDTTGLIYIVRPSSGLATSSAKQILATTADYTLAVAGIGGYYYVFYSDNNQIIQFKKFDKYGNGIGSVIQIGSLPNTPAYLYAFPTREGNINLVGNTDTYQIYGMQINVFGDIIVAPQLLMTSTNIHLNVNQLLDGTVNFLNPNPNELELLNNKVADRIIVGDAGGYLVIDSNLNIVQSFKAFATTMYAMSGIQIAANEVYYFNQFGGGTVTLTNVGSFNVTTGANIIADTSLLSAAYRSEMPLIATSMFDYATQTAYFFRTNYVYRVIPTMKVSIVSDIDVATADYTVLLGTTVSSADTNGFRLDGKLLLPQTVTATSSTLPALSFKNYGNRIEVFRESTSQTLTVTPILS